MTKLKKNSTILKFLSVILFFEIFFSVIFIYRPIPHAGWVFKIFTAYDDQKMNTKKYNKAWDYKKERYKPGIHKNEYTTFHINKWGFRGVNFNKEKKANTIRIITYGDSLTVGLESPDNLTYPFLLEKKLKENSNNFEVLNFGAGNRTLSWIYELIYTELKDYSPDFIVVQNNFSSAAYDSLMINSSGKELIKNEFDLFILKLHRILANNIMIYRGLDRIYKILYVNLYIGNNSITEPIGSKESDINYFEKDYYNKLNSLLELGRKNNFRLVVIEEKNYINSLFQKKFKKKDLNELFNILKNFNVINFEIDEKSAFLAITNTILNKQLNLLKKNNPDVILINTTNIFSSIEKEEATVDGLHLTPYGNSVIANEVAKKILLNL